MFQYHVKGSSRLLIDRKLNERNAIVSFYSVEQYILFRKNAKPYNLKRDNREERLTLNVYAIVHIQKTYS